MAKVKLGSQEFDVNCRMILATDVSDEECVALGVRMKAREIRVGTVLLVRFFFMFFSS